MNIKHRPIRTTVLYGVLCALLFVPAYIFLRPFFSWSGALQFLMWIYISGYCVLLVRWSSRSLSTVLFPMILPLLAILWGLPMAPFVFLLIGIVSWVRSGICFQHSLIFMVLAELALGFGGTLAVMALVPHSAIFYAVGVWLFFLIQSMYFVFFPPKTTKEEALFDPFEKARKEADSIVSST